MFPTPLRGSATAKPHGVKLRNSGFLMCFKLSQPLLGPSNTFRGAWGWAQTTAQDSITSLARGVFAPGNRMASCKHTLFPLLAECSADYVCDTAGLDTWAVFLLAKMLVPPAFFALSPVCAQGKCVCGCSAVSPNTAKCLFVTVQRGLCSLLRLLLVTLPSEVMLNLNSWWATPAFLPGPG